MIVPEKEIERLSPMEQQIFRHWAQYMHDRVKFNLTGSEIHAMPHCERVLLYSLLIGASIFGDDEDALTILAHASIFHDTRRQDDYLDTGHGARAAVYYEDFCKQNPDITYHPEAAYLMRYHDLDDKIGREAIIKAFPNEADRVLKLYAIFKDSDALDRWRLGNRGLDARYLRTDKAKNMVDYARGVVAETTPKELLDRIEEQVNRTLSCDK